jgi:hypothetical protein
LHNKELHNLYSSPNIKYHIIYKIKENEMGGHVARIGEERNVCTVLVGKPQGKRPLRRPRNRLEDGIRMDVGETDWEVWTGFNWLRIAASGRMLSMRRQTFGFWRHGVSYDNVRRIL